jgi:hypothetical protein
LATISLALCHLNWAPDTFGVADLSNMTMVNGSIPSEIALLTSLLYLDLSGSSGLYGTIPDVFCYLQNTSCTFLDFWGDPYNCTLDFDCSDILCGCDCPCWNDTGFNAGGVEMEGLGLPSKSNATL